MDSKLSLSLFGSFMMLDPAGSTLNVSTRKAKGLVAYLALRPRFSDSRPRLAALLWGDQSEKQARGNLRQTLSRLRKDLKASGETLLCAQGEQIVLNGEILTVDARELERLVADGTPASLALAVEHYRGGLLDDVAVSESAFEEWVRLERERFFQLAHSAHAQLLSHFVETGALHRAITIGQRLLAFDPLDEATHHTLIRLYWSQDRVGAALKQYQHLETVLRDELDVEPNPDTQRLHRAILNSIVDDEAVALLHTAEEPPAVSTKCTRLVVPSVSEQRADGAGRPTAAGENVVAVLPFETIGIDSDSRYLGAALASEIIAALTRFRELAVIARESSFSLAGRSLAASTIGHCLDARYLLTGTIEQKGGLLQVSTHLLDTGKDQEVWSEIHSLDRQALHGLRDDVTGRIVASMVGRIESDRLASNRGLEPQRLRTYDHWLRGMSHLHQSRHAVALARAQDCFEQASAEDPEFARAYSGLALVHMSEWSGYAWSPMNWKQEACLKFASRAVELDDSDAQPRCILGMMRLYQGEFDAARKHLERATLLNPNDAFTRACLAYCLPFFGEVREAVLAGEASLRLNPYNPDWYHSSLGTAHFFDGSYDKALDYLEPIPDVFCDTPGYLAATHAYLGNVETAAAYADTAEQHFRLKQIAYREYRDLSCLEWLTTLTPFLRAQEREHFTQGLVEAGIR